MRYYRIPSIKLDDGFCCNARGNREKRHPKLDINVIPRTPDFHSSFISSHFLAILQVEYRREEQKKTKLMMFGTKNDKRLLFAHGVFMLTLLFYIRKSFPRGDKSMFDSSRLCDPNIIYGTVLLCDSLSGWAKRGKTAWHFFIFISFPTSKWIRLFVFRKYSCYIFCWVG